MLNKNEIHKCYSAKCEKAQGVYIPMQYFSTIGISGYFDWNARLSSFHRARPTGLLSGPFKEPTESRCEGMDSEWFN